MNESVFICRWIQTGEQKAAEWASVNAKVRKIAEHGDDRYKAQDEKKEARMINQRNKCFSSSHSYPLLAPAECMIRIFFVCVPRAFAALFSIYIYSNLARCKWRRWSPFLHVQINL